MCAYILKCVCFVLPYFAIVVLIYTFRFGSEVDVLHKFTQQFTTQSGAFILEQMSFQQPKTNFVKVLVAAYAM